VPVLPAGALAAEGRGAAGPAVVPLLRTADARRRLRLLPYDRPAAGSTGAARRRCRDGLVAGGRAAVDARGPGVPGGTRSGTGGGTGIGSWRRQLEPRALEAPFPS